jgi:hypothetical protein
MYACMYICIYIYIPSPPVGTKLDACNGGAVQESSEGDMNTPTTL